MRPLDGFRVLDLTRFLSGPYCTMVLAELGADVIKVEQPVTGRRLPPAGAQGRRRELPVRDAQPEQALGVAGPQDRRAAATCSSSSPRETDLVMENFRPGVARPPRHRLRRRHARCGPDVIYCSISGFGQTGPYKSRPGFDIWPRAPCGFLRMTGAPDGQPAKIGIAIRRFRSRRHGHLLDHSPRSCTAPAHRRGATSTSPWSTPPWPGRSGSRAPTSAPARCPQPTGTRHRRSTPYPGLPDHRRLRHHRRRQRPPVDTAGHSRARPARVARETPDSLTLPDRMAHIEALEPEDRGDHHDADHRTTGSRPSTGPAFPVARCSPSTRRSPTPTCWRAT